MYSILLFNINTWLSEYFIGDPYPLPRPAVGRCEHPTVIDEAPTADMSTVDVEADSPRPAVGGRLYAVDNPGSQVWGDGRLATCPSWKFRHLIMMSNL